ncbi:hypothetical protein [Devosia aquimaris]|uniref:hypothetical protein n=1 Tax=Devosia aquimaris TaxID=2866214 RepID=UPI001CD149F7|nr:hypothetical protein [Devosia sp. CJK-A8-3]
MVKPLNFDPDSSVLGSFGFRIGAEKLEMHSEALFKTCWIHHSQVPLAVLAGALTNPAAVKRRFGDYQLMHLVTKRWGMDEDDAVTLAILAGAEVSPPFYAQSDRYAALLEEVIARYRLEGFFELAPGSSGHYAIRPWGHGQNDREAFDVALKSWRRAYRRLDPPTQMLLASILWLYSGGDRSDWMKGLSRSWRAVDAIAVLHSNRMLVDWARLTAMYPGW